MPKILVISDFENYQYFESNFESLQDVDFVISCGDLSIAYLYKIQKILNKPLYFLYGNHVENKLIHHNIKYVGNKMIDVCGLKIAGIDGIEATDSKKIIKSTKRLLKKGKNIDILVTHNPTKGLGDGSGYHVGSDCFKELYNSLSVKIHFYGHYHLNYGGTREILYNGVRVINAYDHYIMEL